MNRLLPAALGVAVALGGCVTISDRQRALIYEPGGEPRAESLACGRPALGRASHAPTRSLDPGAITLLTWNIHKNGDPGWQRDLDRFARGHSLVLLQEASLGSDLRAILESSGLEWILASAFALDGRETGVMTASSANPLAVCTLRQSEPLIRLPKAATVTHYRLAGHPETLAVANLHSINFSLSLGAYTRQLEAVAAALSDHRGPLILAGDLNTWTDARRAAVDEVAARLGLVDVPITPDGRTRFLGKQIDHVFVRGLEAVSARAIDVKSSDHNPVSALLRVPEPGR